MKVSGRWFVNGVTFLVVATTSCTLEWLLTVGALGTIKWGGTL